MTADEILAAIAAEVGEVGGCGVPSLANIHERMIRVEELADEYAGRLEPGDEYDALRLLRAMLSAHATFRDWIGAYS